MAADQYRLGIKLDFRTNGDQDIRSIASRPVLEKGGKDRKDEKKVEDEEKEWRKKEEELKRRKVGV